MREPQFIIAGDVEIPEGVTQIRLMTPLARYDFVTVEMGSEDTLHVHVIPVEELQDFDGILFQADSGKDDNTVVLRQLDLSFWPFGEAEEDEADEDDDGGDDDEGDDEEDEEEDAVESTSPPKPFKVVSVKWWDEYMRKHDRG